MNHHRKALIEEWLNKAEGDFEAAQALYSSHRKRRLLFIIAFHCQQAVEKYLKALLICYDMDFPKIHDLLQLQDLIIVKDPFLKGIRKELMLLNPYAVGFRYPGEDISPKELLKVMRTARELRKILYPRISEIL